MTNNIADSKTLVKNDSGKTRYELIDPVFLAELAGGLTYGAKTYAPNNWRKPIDDISRLYGALMRHVEALRQGEFFDKDSHLPHTAHATCELMFIRYHLGKKDMNGLKLPEFY